MTDLLFGRAGLYHLLVSFPSVLFWAALVYYVWMRLSGWRLVWTYRNPMLPAEFKSRPKGRSYNPKSGGGV